MEPYSLGNIDVSIILGKFDDVGLDLVVISKDIPLGIAPSSGGAVEGFGITIKEASNAENIIHWPTVTMDNPERRNVIYNTTKQALDTAENLEATQIGFYTMGLEVSRLPTWEIAEEIIKAINDHAKNDTRLDRIMLIASSPTQVSSFQYAIDNVSIITGK